MSKHTDGPWHDEFISEKSWHKGIYDQGGNEVAVVKVKSALVSQRKDADARLIAAAPDLLAALEGLLNARVYADAEGMCYIESTDVEGSVEAVEKARSAIAKAKGE